MTSSAKFCPLISVYLPTKNRITLLRRAIDSVLSQNYSNFELIVVDDGSTDETPGVLKDYQQKSDKIFVYRNSTSMGVAAARNFAIRASSGEFVTGLDDDDYFCPGRLNSLMAAYDDQYAFVCSSVIWDFGERQKVADKKARVFSLQQQLSYNHATTQVLVRRERMLAIGGFDEKLAARLDYDAWTCLMVRYGAARRINPPTYVLSRSEAIERITTGNANVIGNHQFVSKHRAKMNTKNLYNQHFWDMYARNAPFGFIELLRQLWAGNIIVKLKYYVRINFLDG
jgi:glycosyltransferase involved in cell wall biosynthesis